MKIIVFDFDGTLTKKSENIWKSLWVELGYPVDKESYYAKLYIAFVKGQITHRQWCEMTADAFKAKGMKLDTLHHLANNTNMLNNLESTLKTLKTNNYKSYIASGNIKEAIKIALGENAKYFENIMANGMIFDSEGYLQDIIGTKYDFEGKKDFVLELAKYHNISPSEIVFVGNGDNDEWVAQTGCKTICINADKTDPNNKQIWTHNAGETNDLSQILQFVNAEQFFI